MNNMTSFITGKRTYKGTNIHRYTSGNIYYYFTNIQNKKTLKNV